MATRSTKKRITDAALDLFEEFGFHAVTVDRIVKQSHTSKGGFYHNFTSKEELLYTIHESFITYVLIKADEVQSRYDTPAERLYEIIRSFVRMFEVYRPHVTVFYQEGKHLSSGYFKRLEAKRDEYKNTMFQLVENGIEEGEFRKELPVPITSMAIFGMMNWTYKWYKSSGLYSLQDIANIFGDLVMNAVLTDEARKQQKYQRFFLNSTHV